MKKVLAIGSVGGLLLSPLVVLAFLSMFFAGSSAATGSAGCDSLSSSSLVSSIADADAPVDPSHVSWATASEVQKKDAQIIKDEVTAHKGDGKHLLVAVMVAIDESEMLPLHYGDRDSLGMFQQRANWGPADLREDAKWSTDRFLTQDTDGAYKNGTLGYLDKEKAGLITATDPWMIAQQVQASGTPDGSNYKKVMGNAQDVISHLGDSPCSSGVPGKGDDYPFKVAGCHDAAAGTLIKQVSPEGAWVCQCTDFVLWRLNQMHGGDKNNIKFKSAYMPSGDGSATFWPDIPAWKNVPRDTNPKVGDAAIMRAGQHGAEGFGHVAFVTKVEGDTISVEEYNVPLKSNGYHGLAYGTEVKHKSDYDVYMHFKDAK